MRKIGLCVVVPVYNKESDLPKNIPKLSAFLGSKMGEFDWEIVIADNASTDQTPIVARKLARDPKIEYLYFDKKGRGLALKKVWDQSPKEILSYMDVDLSSDLNFFPSLIAAIEKGADIAIGSRLAQGAKVSGRTILREAMSRGYSFLFRIIFWTKFKDAQCGFKAIEKTVWQKISPQVKDTQWFFDTEFLILAQKAGFRIAEVPIVWHDDPASTVKVAKTAWGDIKGLFRLLITRPWRKIQ